jgi:hypothetical protein
MRSGMHTRGGRLPSAGGKDAAPRRTQQGAPHATRPLAICRCNHPLIQRLQHRSRGPPKDSLSDLAIDAAVGGEGFILFREPI